MVGEERQVRRLSLAGELDRARQLGAALNPDADLQISFARRSHRSRSAAFRRDGLAGCRITRMALGKIDQTPKQSDGYVHLRNRNESCIAERSSSLRSRDVPVLVILRNPLFQSSIGRPVRGNISQDLLNDLQAAFDTLRQIGGGMHPAKDIFNGNGHRRGRQPPRKPAKAYSRYAGLRPSGRFHPREESRRQA